MKRLLVAEGIKGRVEASKKVKALREIGTLLLLALDFMPVSLSCFLEMSIKGLT